MDINEKQNQKIIELAGKYELKLILLFGSRASGHARQDSDIDLAYFSSKNLSFEEENIINMEFCNTFQTDMVDTVNLKTAHPLLLNQILENNKIIFEESPIYYSIFEVSTLQKYKEAELLFDMRSERLEKIIANYD